MLGAVLHRLVVLLTVIAFVGGMTLQLMPPKEAFAASRAAGSDCPHMAAMQAKDMGTAPAMPRKGIDPECVKQMKCLGTAGLPLPQLTASAVFAYSKVAYWLLASFPGGRSIKPALLPPIGL